MSSPAGYIYITGWDKFQHPDAVRSSHMPWLKLHTDMLGNDAWLGLSCADRTLLQGLWMLTARYGNGRCNADLGWINGQLKIRKGSLDRLSHAGFIEVRASKAASRPASKVASTDKEGSYEPKKESVASSARRNGAARKHRKHVAHAVATATSWLEEEPAHLVHRTVREAWPDLADEIITTLSRAETTQNGSNHEKPAAQEPPSAPRATAGDEPLAEISDDDIPF
jgi:hypothetical protein